MTDPITHETIVRFCQRLRSRCKAEADAELDSANARIERNTEIDRFDEGTRKCAQWISKHIAQIDLEGWLSQELLFQGVVVPATAPAIPPVNQHTPPAPIPLILTCPVCNYRHIDRGEFETKVHHTHSCQACGITWRPAIVPTVGVQFLPGFKDKEEPHLR